MTFTPTEEQAAIGRSIRSGRHVVVDAVAGAGKTSSALYLADLVRKQSGARTLILLYNRRLASETAKKIPVHLQPYVDATTIHSFAFRMYASAPAPADGAGDTEGASDTALLNDELLEHLVGEGAATAPQAPFNYGLVIVDEAQDLVALYHAFITQKVFADNQNPSPQVAVYGDCRQTIYAFNGADIKYLTDAPDFFTPPATVAPPRDWVSHTLSVSFRVPSAIAGFVNKAMLHEPRLRAFRTSAQKPVYAVINVFTPTYVLKVIKDWLRRYTASDIFVLCPSTRAKGPMLRVLNTLTDDGVPVYVLESNLDPVHQDLVMKDKVVFSTFHKSKGLERKCVLVFGFDASYLEFYNPTADPAVCPNELYVAATRASEELVLVANRSHPPLPFLAPDLESVCTVEVIDRPVVSRRAPAGSSGAPAVRVLHPSVVSTMASREQLAALRALVTIENSYPAGGAVIDMPVLDKYRTEDVSDINGMACTMFYEYCVTGCVTSHLRCTTPAAVPGAKRAGNTESRFLSRQRVEQLNSNLAAFVLDCSRVFDIPQFMRFVTTVDALGTQMFYRLFQLRKFDWLNAGHMTGVHRNMAAAVSHITEDPSPAIVFEEPVSAIVGSGDAVVVGRTDLLVGGELVEIKCVADLLIEHVLQCVLYMFATRRTTCYLYNVKKNHMQTITVTGAAGADADAALAAFVASLI